MSSIFPEPPTRATLDDARRVLAEQRQAAQDISARIQDAEDELDRIVKASQNAIQEMQKERSAIEDQVAQTLAYLSHIRRLPHELLGQIFTFIFEDYPCCAWVLAAVCSLWRREVLSMPKLWSKVCTPSFASATRTAACVSLRGSGFARGAHGVGRSRSDTRCWKSPSFSC